MWSDLDDDSLWKHIEDAGGLVDVGLRKPGRRRGMERGRVLVSLAERAAGRSTISGIRGIEVLSVDTLLPIVKLRLRDRAALARVRRMPQVEYVEPGAFADVTERGRRRWQDVQSGCTSHPYDGPWLNTQIPPGDVLPWNYRWMWIDSAWTYTSGRGVSVGLVDTGIDEDGYEMDDDFATGWSAGRTITLEATVPAGGGKAPWHDTCGHGTRMASVIAGPRNGKYIMGVAWGANLHVVRVDDDVLLSEVDATRYGIRRAATTSPVVALAFGVPIYYSAIAQELEYWYYNSERIIIAAAGTSPCWQPIKNVVFPGSLQTVITVTAFDENGGIACNAHRGWQVDFAAYTDQPATGLHILAPNVAGLGGSSGATAVIAGVAALYLSRYPGATRNQFLSALTVAASPTGGRSPLWGFGVPNLACLMKEMCTAWIEGPTLIQTSGLYTWTAYQRSSPGPISYQWGSGEATQSITRYVSVTPGMPEYLFAVNVTVRDTRNGRTRIDSKPVVVRDPYGCPTCF